jgi:hypothetical protein
LASFPQLSNTLQRLTAKRPFWLWPNLLSLDAPLIASLWQDVFARDAGVKLTLASRMALPLAVWLIYLVDRLLDTVKGMPQNATARHAFYCVHRGACLLLTAVVALMLCLSVLFLPPHILRNGLLVGCFIAAYLLLVHWFGTRRLPKEAVVGLLFAVGTALAPFTRASPASELVFPALLFGILCWANSSAIEIWEGGAVDRASAWMVRHLKTIAVAICVLCAPLLLGHASQAGAMTLILAAIGYWGIADAHTDLGANSLRVAIDLPLLAPLLLIGLR